MAVLAVALLAAAPNTLALTNNLQVVFSQATDANAPCRTEDCCPPGAWDTGDEGEGLVGCIPCYRLERWKQQRQEQAEENEARRKFNEGFQRGPGGVSVGSSSDGSGHVSYHVGGMPRWVVTEPEVNLWLQDRPLRYTPSRGPAVELVLRYKNEAGAWGEFSTTDGTAYDLLDTNLFTLGWRWGFNWRAWVEPGPASTNVVLHSSEGRVLRHDLGQIEYHTQSTMTLVTTNALYQLAYPNGANDYYGVRTVGGTHCGAIVVGTNLGGSTVTRYFLAQRTDPHGDSLTFYYSTNGAAKLVAVCDADNRVTTLSYGLSTNATFAALIWKIADPETNVVEFQHTVDGCLTNIIDPAGIASWMTYDTEKNVSGLMTPYGTTRFQFPMSADYRAVHVTEPNGAQHLWIAGDAIGFGELTQAYVSDHVPCTEAEDFSFNNTFHNEDLDRYDSLYWSPRQYALLSAEARTALTNNRPDFWTNLTYADCLVARLRHWLKAGTNANLFSLTLAMERAPSPDGETEGLKTWYDHDGKPPGDAGREGTQRWPRCVAVRAPGSPGGESTFTWFVRNTLGHPTQVIESHTDSTGAWAVRTNHFSYAEDGVDLLTYTNALGIAVFGIGYATNAPHRLQSATNALGEVTTFAYNPLGQVTNISRPTGLNTAYLYRTNAAYSNWLDQVIHYDSVGGSNRVLHSESFTYSAGRLQTRTDARGLVTTYFWDGLGRATGRAFTTGVTITNLYVLSGSNSYPDSTGGTSLLDMTRTCDANGHWTEYTYDTAGRVTAITDALTNRTEFQYCDCGALERVTTAMTNVTRFEYDHAGRRVQTVHPSGLTVNETYDDLGRLEQVADSHGYRLATLNNQGLVTAIGNAVGQVLGLEYDVLDRLVAQTNADGVVTTHTYDDLGRVATRLIAGTATERFYYSPRGLSNYVDALSNSTWYAYDALGRLSAQTNANNEAIGFTYSAASDLLTLVDGRGKQTSWGYDGYGRVTSKTNHNGIALFRYEYDAGGRLTNRWSVGKGNTRYAFDAVGNLTTVTYEANTNGFGTNVLTFAYDKDARLTSMVDASGTTAYTYRNGLLAAEDGPWASDTVSYEYTYGRRQSITVAQPVPATWQEVYGYDDASRLIQVVSPAGQFDYTYAGPGTLVTNLALPGGSAIGNQYDSVGRMTGTWLRTALEQTLNSHRYTYNVGSQRTRQTRVAGDYADYGYDPIGQLTSAFGKESGGVTNRLAEQLGYLYDAAGNLQYRTNNALIQTFAVDNLNGLTNVSRTGTLTVAGGTTGVASNLTVQANSETNATSAVLYADGSFARAGVTLADGTNTFTAVAIDNYGRRDTNTVTAWLPASATFAYDDNGNLLTDGRRGFQYDAENQLVCVTVTNAWQSRFTYDALGRRRVRAEYEWRATTTNWVLRTVARYVYDGMLVVQERDANNLLRVTYTRGRDLSGRRQGAGGIGGMLARTDNPLLASGDAAAHAYYHADGNGNITALVDASGAVVARYLYDPYANLLAKGGPVADANLYRFSSKEQHASSGLYYYGYRFYEPSVQRWLTSDPIGERGSINLHCFTYNSPLTHLDPLGLDIDYGPGEGPEQARKWLNCWRNELPRDSKLWQLISELDRPGQTTMICKLTGVRDASGKQCETPYGLEERPGKYHAYMDNRAYHYNNDPNARLYQFWEMLVHELLHAHDDMIKKNHRGHGEGFWGDQAEMLKEVENALMRWK